MKKLLIFVCCIIILFKAKYNFDKIEKKTSQNLYYFDSRHSEGKSSTAHCNSFGLEYAGEVSPDSTFFVCRGNLTKTAIQYHSKHVLFPKSIHISNHPVVKINNPHEQSSFQGHNDDMNIWHFPPNQPSDNDRVAFHLNAYGLIDKGYDGRNVTLTLIDSCFNIHNNDVHGLVKSENDIDSSNDIEHSTDGGDCEHGTEIWSILTGRKLCTQGIIPQVSIEARVIPIENNLLTDIEFGRSHHANAGQILVRTFNPTGYNPLTGTNVPYYDKSDMPPFVSDIIKAGTRRGGTYFVSAGNYGNTFNLSSARTCLDSTIGGQDGLIPIAATTPSGLAWYSNRGCIAFAAPGGDRASCISANNGNDCTCVAGTSFSTPLAAANAVTLQQVCGNQLNKYDIYDILVKTSTNVGVTDSREGYQFFTNGAGYNYSDAYGYGLINFKKSIEYVEKNHCPKMPPVTSCFSSIGILESNDSRILTSEVSIPSSCSVKNIAEVKVYSTFSWALTRVSNWIISSPLKKIGCTILPFQHPYIQDSLDAASTCHPFYMESPNGTWTIRFNKKSFSYGRATFQLEIVGFI